VFTKQFKNDTAYIYNIVMNYIEDSSFPVVCIQEHDDTTNMSRVDTTIFFTYDGQYNEYVLWGKRDKYGVPFMFRFDEFKDMYNFIHMSILSELSYDDTSFTITLNNYNNFPIDFNVSYQFLHDNLDVNYEITGYNAIKKDVITKKYLRKWAHICKHSYNRIDGEIV
jgi:hypothetical protein